MPNKVTFGLSNVHVAFVDTDGTYETPIHIPGAVSWTPSTAGDASNFAADNNGKYHTINTNDGYTADMAMALFPDSVISRMLGWEIDENGALIELADGRPEKFALMFQVEGDAANRRTVYYDCQANRPAKEHQTTGESTEITPDQLSITVSKKTIDGKPRVKATLELSDTNATQYNGFFGTVYGVEVDPGV